MQPLKSFVAEGLAVGLLDGGEHVFIGFGLASEISLSEDILQGGIFLRTSFDIGKLGRGFVNFFSILTLALGTITVGVFLLGGGGDILTVRTSQSLVAVVVRGFDGTVPRYLAKPPLFLCTVGGLRNSVVDLATSTDIVSDVFLSFGCCGLI